MIRAILLFLVASAAWAQDPVSWDTLGQVQLVRDQNIYVPRFADAVLKLDAREVKLQGFMLPLTVGEKQTHFVLTANPSECSFCVSGGPESMVEVRSKPGLKYSLDPVMVKGRLELVRNDPGAGVFYRLHDAVPAVK